MAINSNNQLSDVDLEVGTGQLSELSSKWNSDVLNTGLSSLNINGAFSALMGQGVGTQYIESLENAIKKAEQNALNISKIIAATAQEQDAADQKAATISKQNSYSSFTGGTSRVSTGTSSITNTGSYTEKENVTAEMPEKEEDTEKKELTNEEVIKIVEEFQSINNGSLYDILFNKDFASKLKEQLLASPNLSEDTKKILMEMDPKTIQVNLQNILLSGETITGFSKIVVTIFDNKLGKRSQKVTLFDISKNISDVYSKLAEDVNYQETLYKIYTGDVSRDEIDDETILFTRDFVDSLAASSDATYQEVLTQSKHKESLEVGIKDIANTFAILRGAKESGDTAVSSKLYSSIIVKEKGNGVYA